MAESENFAQGGNGDHIGVYSYYSAQYAGWVVSKQVNDATALIVAGPFPNKLQADAWAQHEVAGRVDGHRLIELQGA